jgi:integrase
MLTIAKRSRKIHDIPLIQFLKEPPARKGFLLIEKFEELISLLPTHLRPLVTLLYYCGTRIGEALQIEWGQVNLVERTIRLEEEQTKGDEARTLPLPPALVMMLQARDVEPKTGKVFDGTNLRKEWMNACAACGLGTLTEVEGRPYDPLYSGLTLHDLRRSAVRNLVNAGVPERVAMSISGHKTRSVFDRYHIVSTVDVTDAMQKVVASSLGTASANKPAQSVRSMKKELKA